MKYTKKINDTYKISAILFSKQNQYYAQNHFRVNALPETKIRIQVCNTLHTYYKWVRCSCKIAWAIHKYYM